MEKTLDFNKLAKAHQTKKAWELVQKEKAVETSDLDSNRDPAEQSAKS